LIFSTSADGSDSPTERLRITSDGNIGINDTTPTQKLDVGGAIQASGGFKTAGHPILGYASFTDIGSDNYATRVGSTGTSTLRHTQIYGGGSHIATFDGANTRLGINETSPDDRIEIRTTAHGQGVTIKSTGNTSNALTFDANRGTQGVIGVVYGRWNGTTVAQMNFISGDDGTDKNDGYITFGTESAASNGNVNATERLRITSGGNLITFNNHTSGSSAHQNTGWYGDDADHYTLEYKDFNEIRAIKTRNVSDYSSIVYKRETMTEYCDIEFTLKGNTPTGTYRHVGFIINGDGSDTTANMDRLVFRSRPASTTHNTIRLDKGGGGYGFNHSGSDIPTFFDGNERHVHIQIRKRTFSITVNRQGHSEYNLSTRMSGDLVASRGYFGFTIYEQSSQGNPEITIRDFKITNYTQNAVPTTSVAFQASIGSGNPSKSSGQVVKPASNEHWDNGYGGNYNTSNYRFTAPVAGIYQFSNTHNVYSSPNGQWAGIKVNGSTLYVGTKINDNVGSGDHNMTCYVTTQLEKGDYVEAIDYTGNSQTYSSGASWNRFEGSLIAAYK